MYHRLTAAITQVTKHTRVLVEFNQILDRDHPGICEEWIQLVHDWEMDSTKPCPYVVEAPSVSASQPYLPEFNLTL